MPALINASRSSLALTLILLLPCWVLAAGSASTGRRTLDYFVAFYCHQYSVSEAWVRAIITVESSWQPDVVSEKGAAGLRQLMPGTARRFGIRNRFDSAANIEAGVRYLAELLDRFNGERILATAAYFAGEKRIAARNVGILPPDVAPYVRKVYSYLVDETLKGVSSAPAAGKVQRSINPFPRTPTPRPPTRGQGSLQKAQTPLPILKTACHAGTKQKPCQCSLLPFQGLSARRIVTDTAEARCQSLPLHPLRLPRAFATAGPAPSFSTEPQGGEKEAQPSERNENQSGKA
jgi:hypothetical protein